MYTSGVDKPFGSRKVKDEQSVDLNNWNDYSRRQPAAAASSNRRPVQ